MKPLTITSDMAVVAVLGFSIWEVHKAYSAAVPNMSVLRECPPGDKGALLQHLVDADITVGGITLLAGIAASVMTRSFVPLILIGGTYGILAYYHHAVLAAPNP